jgi:aspartokinase
MSENNNQSLGDLFPDLGPEVPIISGVAHDNTESLATVRRVPNEPGMAAKVFTLLAEAEVKSAADAPRLTFGGAMELLWQSLLGA